MSVQKKQKMNISGTASWPRRYATEDKHGEGVGGGASVGLAV